MPLIYPFVLDKTSLGMYWTLQEYFRTKDPAHGVQDFRSLIGHLHQDYVADLLTRIYKGLPDHFFYSESELKATVTPQGYEEGLPDAILVEADALVVFEMSVTALTYGLLVSGDSDRFERETAEKFRPKLEQVWRSINDLLEGRWSSPGVRVETIRHVYPVLVLLFPFPQQVLTWKLLDGIVQTGRKRSHGGGSVEIHHPQIVTDEELEILEPHINASSQSLSGLLSRKTSSLASRWISMKNFMFLFERVQERDNSAMLGLYTTATERAKEILRSELALG